jgi:hypothetical protein
MLLLASCLVAGCAGEGELPVDSSAPPDMAITCDSSLTYADYGAAFLGSHCNSCHGFNQSSVQSNAAGLSGIVLGGFMPPGGGGLTAAQRNQFADWLACGAP